MDRGAARSRKRAAKLEKSALANPTSSGPTGYRPGKEQSWNRDNATAGPSRPRAPLPSQEDSRPRKPSGPQPKLKKERKIQSDDPNQYKPKAIRNSTALIYSSSPFAIPPPGEGLKGVTRIDLAGSGCTDVSWLEGTEVTWLSLKGCPVTRGWEAVGGLRDLAVLNISECGISSLPKSLKGLGKLKAVVAMSNPWHTLDSEVLGSWTELNSLIISHSPNLKSLPSALEDLPHLSKLTFSHCPRITASSLVDLSGLPLLRDVKMNNLPQLTSLPPHIRTWGTGDLSQVKSGTDDKAAEKRQGEGLEVLDLGNCSLDWTSVSNTFGLVPSSTTATGKKATKTWGHLRSLTLHSNPFVTTHPDYADLLQSAPSLPKLQIIDSKRVVQRAHAGEVPLTKYEKLKKERKERKYGKSDAGYTKRVVRPTVSTEPGEDAEAEVRPVEAQKEKKEKRETAIRRKAEMAAEEDGHAKSEKKRKRDEAGEKPVEKRSKVSKTTAEATVPLPAVDASDPSLITSETSKKRGAPTESSVLSIIEIPRDRDQAPTNGGKGPKIKAKDKSSKSKGKDGKVVEEVKTAGGIDLRGVFAAPKPSDGEDGGTGLGVGGW